MAQQDLAPTDWFWISVGLGGRLSFQSVSTRGFIGSASRCPALMKLMGDSGVCTCNELETLYIHGYLLSWPVVIRVPGIVCEGNLVLCTSTAVSHETALFFWPSHLPYRLVKNLNWSSKWIRPLECSSSSRLLRRRRTILMRWSCGESKWYGE